MGESCRFILDFWPLRFFWSVISGLDFALPGRMGATKTATWFAEFIGLWIVLAMSTLAQAAPTGAIERGQYLARAGDCTSCHTADKGRPFAGGRPIVTPFGTIYSTNLTPDPQTGIGRWSSDDFYRAMHDGIRRDGKHLYPAFPYPWFTRLTRSDVDAIRAFLATVEPVQQKNLPTKLVWPLNWRGGMAVWNMLYFHEGEFREDKTKTAAWNRGAYLVQGLGHCGLCHTPKNALGATEKDRALFGGDAGAGWFASSLSDDLRDGVGAWSTAEIAEYLRTGSNANTAAAGPMTEVVQNSTQYLSDSDLTGIADYLKNGAPPRQSKTMEMTDLGGAALARGEALYLDNCTACHMDDGGGLAHAFPPLKGSAAIQAEVPDTVIHVVLTGAKMADPPSKPTGLAMPAFDRKFDDQQLADVVNYIRHAWGNSAPLVTAGEVSEIRKTVAKTTPR